MRLCRPIALTLLVVTTTACHSSPLAPSPASQATQALPVRPGPGIPFPQRTKNVNPIYPQEALQARVQGIVIMEITIDPAGKISNAVVTQSIPLLDQAALDAVRQWEYTPTVVDGKAVPVIITVTVNFTLQ